MGLFNKFKGHIDGGVKVKVQVPGSVPSNQLIPVTVNVTSDSAQTINNVKAELRVQTHEQGMVIGNQGMGGMGVQSSETMKQTVAQVESREPFAISPGETKTVSLQLYLNGNNNGLNQLGNVGGLLGGVLQSLANAAQGLEHVSYQYSVRASVDVQGHSLSPSDEQSVQLSPPPASSSVTQQTTDGPQ